jgi:hypothetical protein
LFFYFDGVAWEYPSHEDRVSTSFVENAEMGMELVMAVNIHVVDFWLTPPSN